MSDEKRPDDATKDEPPTQEQEASLSVEEPMRSSTAGPEKHEARRDIASALGRLVPPLDQILVLMRDHQEAQKNLHGAQRQALRLSVAVALLVFSTVVYQWRLTIKLDKLEDQLAAVGRTGDETKGKIAEAEKKIDETKTKTIENSQKIDESSGAAFRHLIENATVLDDTGNPTVYVAVTQTEPASPSTSSRPWIALSPRPRASAATSTTAMSPRPNAFTTVPSATIPSATTYVPR